jgi:hypothetical protein
MSASKDELRSRLGELLNEAIMATKRLLHEFKIAPRTPPEKLFVLLVCYDLLRKAQSVEAMTRAKAYAGVNVVLRSAMENYIDVLNLLSHRERYADYLAYLTLEGQRAYHAAMLADPESPFGGHLRNGEIAGYDMPLKEALAKVERDLEERAKQLPRNYHHKKKNGAPGAVITTVKWRFELANRTSWYEGVYRLLSYGTHARLPVMFEGVREDNCIVWPPREPSGVSSAGEGMCTILVDAAFRLAKNYNRPHAHFQRIGRQHLQVLEQMEGAE